MDKKIKQSILILGVLVVLSVAFAVVFYLQKQGAEQQAAMLSGRVSEYETKDRETQKKLKELTDASVKMRQDLDQSVSERTTAVQKAEAAQREAERLSKDLDKVKQERGELDAKLNNLRSERDDLISQVTQLKNRPIPEKIVEKIVYRDKPVEVLPAAGATEPGAEQGVTPAQAMNDVFAAAATSSLPSAVGRENENYWASVIRDKAALEIELKKIKAELNRTGLVIAEYKKNNSDLEVELGRIKNEKEAIIRKIKYGEDLADNISVELARARNEQKVSQDRADQLLAENQQLRLDIKQLTTTKVSLERSISNLTEEKGAIEKKLAETEGIIQNRIDEMWQIKKDIDTRFQAKTTGNGEVELAPIVVKAKKGGDVKAEVEEPSKDKACVKAPAKAAKSAKARKLQGGILSVNEENNFVIVDIGEQAGVQAGDTFKVYHNGKQIGMVEIIQVRQDISAADIKQKTVPLSIGDTIK